MCQAEVERGGAVILALALCVVEAAVEKKVGESGIES